MYINALFYYFVFSIHMTRKLSSSKGNQELMLQTKVADLYTRWRGLRCEHKYSKYLTCDISFRQFPGRSFFFLILHINNCFPEQKENGKN